jgi:DNA-binding XRE family transcriptional regulator
LEKDKMTANNTPLSAAIRSIRTRLELSQEALGRILSVRGITVWRWEKGLFVPRAWELISLYRHASTEAERGAILQVLDSQGIDLKMGAGAGGSHETILPSGYPCNA